MKNEPKRLLVTESNDYIFETETEIIPSTKDGKLGFTITQRTRVTKKPPKSPPKKQCPDDISF